jgi:hypothetical protein
MPSFGVTAQGAAGERKRIGLITASAQWPGHAIAWSHRSGGTMTLSGCRRSFHEQVSENGCWLRRGYGLFCAAERAQVLGESLGRAVCSVTVLFRDYVAVGSVISLSARGSAPICAARVRLRLQNSAASGSCERRRRHGLSERYRAGNPRYTVEVGMADEPVNENQQAKPNKDENKQAEPSIFDLLHSGGFRTKYTVQNRAPLRRIDLGSAGV